jgi:hypothetical protein
MKFVLNSVLAAALAVTLGSTASLASPAKHRHQKKAAAPHSMTGCLAKGDEANTWKLTNVEGKGPKSVELIDVPSSVDLNAHVGHKVTITGTTVNAKQAAKDEGEKPTKKEMKEERGEHHMKPTAVKMVSESCK